MRIAILSAEVSPFAGGGIAPGVRATAQVLAGAGHHVDLFTRASFRDRASALAADGYDIFQHPRIQWYWVPEPANDAEHWHVEMARSFESAVALVYASGAPDLVELHDYQGLGAIVAAERGGGALGETPVVTRLHTSSEQVARLDATSDVAEISTLERIGLLASDAIVAPSDAVLDYYRTFYDDLVLPDGVAAWPGFLLDDAPTPYGPRPERDRLSLLALGRYQRFKGTDHLVLALRDAPDLPVDLTFVGADTPTGPSGSMREHVEKLAGDDPRFTFHGPVPRAQVGGFLEHADALVIASTWETWGNVGLESLAAARPVIVTPHASLPDMAGHGKFGVVAEGDAREDLEAALRRAVDERHRLQRLCGDPALPAHLDALTNEAKVVAGYEALARRSDRTPRRPLAEWRAAAYAGRRP